MLILKRVRFTAVAPKRVLPSLAHIQVNVALSQRKGIGAQGNPDLGDIVGSMEVNKDFNIHISMYKSILPLSFLFCFSCIYNHTAITENLGGDYFYLADGHESQIILGNEKMDSGITIIPQEVVEYNFNQRYIIARSINIVKKDQYWIVDKESKGLVSPLDSTGFVTEMKRLKIYLKLKERK